MRQRDSKGRAAQGEVWKVEAKSWDISHKDVRGGEWAFWLLPVTSNKEGYIPLVYPQRSLQLVVR